MNPPSRHSNFRYCAFWPGMLTATLLSGNAAAAAFSTDFESYPGPAIPGTDGWKINDSSPELASLEEVVLPNLQSTLAATLGGFYNAPAAPSVILSREYEAVFSQSSFSFTLGIFDSRDANPARDAFGFEISFGNQSLFALFAVPASQTATPETGSSATWNLSTSSGSAPASPLDFAMKEGEIYHFGMSFTAGESSTTSFSLNVIDEAGQTTTRSGSFPAGADQQVDSIGFVWTPSGPPTQAGSNYLLVDNIAAVPEPSSLLLGSLSVLTCLCHHRRRRGC